MATDDEFETEIGVRYRDLDPMDHVNNAVYATYIEQARAEYFEAVIGESLAAVDTVLVSLSIDFRAPITLDDEITVGVVVPELGSAAIPMEYEIRRGDGAVAATAETVQVPYDREAESSRPIPSAWREAIESA